MAGPAGIWLGPAGSLVEVPRVRLGAEAPRQRIGPVHVLAGGGAVMQTSGYQTTWRLTGTWLTQDQFSTWETLASLRGPYRLVDRQRRNLLTPNQSTGGDDLGDLTGVMARFQGTATVDTSLFRSGARSFKWNSVTSLSSTGRGLYWYTSNSAVDHTWAAVLPSTQYTFAAYCRASATLSVRAIIDWLPAGGGSPVGTPISTELGAVTPLGTSNWLSRVFVTGISPPTAAYAVGGVTNTSTPGSVVSFYADDAMLCEGTLADWTLGTGTPLVAVDQLIRAYPLHNRVDAEMTLVELSA